MWLQLLLVLIGIVTHTIYKVSRRFTLFRQMGIDEDPGHFPFGSKPLWQVITGKKNFSQTFDENYIKFAGKKFYGQYGMFGKPMLVVQDMELAKDILIKDFDYFMDRRDTTFGANVYMKNILTILPGDRWKTMRTLMTPVFTSGKLKGMMKLIDKVGDDFVQYLDTKTKDQNDIELKSVFTLFGTEVIATTGFGFEPNVFKDSNCTFKDHIEKMTSTGKYVGTGLSQKEVMLMVTSPKLSDLLGISLLKKDVEEFFVQIIKDQIKKRLEETGTVRNDFIDVMLQGFKSTSNEIIEAEDQFDKDAMLKNSARKDFASKEDLEDVIVSNTLLLFFGGLDNTTTNMVTTTYFLAKNPDVQERLYQEVQEAIDNNEMSQHLDYNILQNLPYLEGCILEALRLFPIGVIERKCVKDYTLRGTKVTVKAGTLIQVPAPKMMKDAKYWKDPLAFNPDRFNPATNNGKRQGGYDFMTFGHGPRNCIGKRFALLQAKVALFRLIANYKVVPCERTPPELIPKSAIIGPKIDRDILVKFVKRD